MGKTIKETLGVMSGAKPTTEPKVREKKEFAREGKTLRQLRSGAGKPEYFCENCKKMRCSPCTCQRKA